MDSSNQQIDSITSPKPRAIRLGDLLDEWDMFAEQAYNARQGKRPLGITTGLGKIDDEMGGVFQTGLHSLQGGTGAGKTAFALQIAASCGFPALYVTCEMAPLELLRRITACATGTFLGRLKSGELTPEQSRELVNRAIAACPDLVILDATRAYVPTFAPVVDRDVPNIYDFAELARGISEHLLVVIDSVHSWADAAPSMLTEYERLNAGLAALRGLAANLNCPVLCIAERNRAGMERGGVNAGAGSRKIEYGAESVIELNRDIDAKPDANNEVEVSLKFSKNRNGSIGRPVELRFNGALQRYREA